MDKEDEKEKTIMHEVLNVDDLYSYIHKYILDNKMEQSIIALDIANKCHKGQKRMEGGPYIIHPLTIARHAISLGVKEDNIIATMILHDVCEDCGVTTNELPVNDVVKQAVKAMTFIVREGEDKEEARVKYFLNIIDNREATVTKIFDRCNNVSTMGLIFSRQRLVKYIKETNKHVIPLIHKTKEKYPEFQQVCFAIEYQIICMLNTVRTLIDNDEDYGL